MNRAHNSLQAIESIDKARQMGFNNLSIDLIYGIQNMSDEQWQRNIQTAIELEIPHLSCYALTVEKGTALDKMIFTKKIAQVNADVQSKQFLMLMESLHIAGYEHYEISNFSKPGYRSRHNSSYWQGSHYLGLGPAAHSYNGNSRQWNVANNVQYIQGMEKGIPVFQKEVLTHVQQMNEYIMTSLRTSEGLSLAFIENYWGKYYVEILQNALVKYLENGSLIFKNGSFILTNEGKNFADGIAADLFQEEPEKADKLL